MKKKLVVLVLHGLHEGVLDTPLPGLKNIVDTVASSKQITRIDYFCFDRKGGRAGILSYRDQVLRHITDNYNGASILIIGWSMGCQVSLLVDRPEIVGRIALAPSDPWIHVCSSVRGILLQLAGFITLPIPWILGRMWKMPRWADLAYTDNPEIRRPSDVDESSSLVMTTILPVVWLYASKNLSGKNLAIGFKGDGLIRRATVERYSRYGFKVYSDFCESDHSLNFKGNSQGVPWVSDLILSFLNERCPR